MRITYSVSREIPTTGYMILVRDKIMYHQMSCTGAFHPLYGVDGPIIRIYKDDVKDTDILYNFPTRTAAYEELINRGCLDRFRVKEGYVNLEEKLAKLLKSGKFIGGHWGYCKPNHKRARIDLLNERIVAIEKTGKVITDPMLTSKVGDIYQEQFDTIYELFQWLYAE